MRWRRDRERGFTLMEVLVGITLTAVIAAGVSPLIISVQRVGLREGDRTVAMLHGRVAAARLERDLRTVTAEGCPFEVSGPILQATPKQVVLLGRAKDSDELRIIEWEIVGSRLMRRWGPCPSQSPEEFTHSVYVDNKTMLEGVALGSSFTYLVEGSGATVGVGYRDLCRVSAVMLSCAGSDAEGEWSGLAEIEARVGR